jgi:transcriptional regulator with XRE-family HTH domain
MGLLSEDDIYARLRQRTAELDISGAELGRALGLGRSQGANLIAGRAKTTLSKLLSWAPVVGMRGVFMLVDATKEPVLDLVLQRCAQMNRERIEYVARFARLIMHASPDELRAWHYQLAGQMQALDDRMNARGEKQTANGRDR